MHINVILCPYYVSWNKPFKQAYKAQYNEWMVSGEKSYTAAGNVRPPDKTLCLKAWKSVSVDAIKKSFVACGIYSSLNGSQDTEISCIKVRVLLLRQLQQFLHKHKYYRYQLMKNKMTHLPTMRRMKMN